MIDRNSRRTLSPRMSTSHHLVAPPHRNHPLGEASVDVFLIDGRSQDLDLLDGIRHLAEQGIDIHPLLASAAEGQSDRQASRDRLTAQFATFDAAKAQCFLPKDRERLLAVVEAGFGDFKDFNMRVRAIFAQRVTKQSGRLARLNTRARAAFASRIASRVLARLERALVAPRASGAPSYPPSAASAATTTAASRSPGPPTPIPYRQHDKPATLPSCAGASSTSGWFGGWGG